MFSYDNFDFLLIIPSNYTNDKSFLELSSIFYNIKSKFLPLIFQAIYLRHLTSHTSVVLQTYTLIIIRFN
jgi:hypothetical protein